MSGDRPPGYPGTADLRSPQAGEPGTAEYFSHAVERPPERFTTLGDTLLPVSTEMRRWLNGDRVLSLAEQFKKFGPQYRDHLHGRRDSPFNTMESTVQTLRERDLFIAEFGFAVPSREVIDLMLGYSPLIEIGAGSGAWSKLLKDRGAHIIATDPKREQYAFDHGRYIPLMPLQGKTAVRRWPDRNVLCVWPSLNETWLRQAARAMRPGRILFVVREDTCAEDSTWNYIAGAFRQIASHELLSWHFMHDRFEAWVKKRKSHEIPELPANTDSF